MIKYSQPREMELSDLRVGYLVNAFADKPSAIPHWVPIRSILSASALGNQKGSVIYVDGRDGKKAWYATLEPGDTMLVKIPEYVSEKMNFKSFFASRK